MDMDIASDKLRMDSMSAHEIGKIEIFSIQEATMILRVVEMQNTLLLSCDQSDCSKSKNLGSTKEIQ